MILKTHHFTADDVIEGGVGIRKVTLASVGAVGQVAITETSPGVSGNRIDLSVAADGTVEWCGGDDTLDFPEGVDVDVTGAGILLNIYTQA